MVADGQDGAPHGRGRSLVPIGVVALGLAIATGAALGAPLVLTGPRISPTVARASVAPPTQHASAPATSEAQKLGARAATHVDVTWVIVVLGILVAAALVIVLARWLRAARRRRRQDALHVAALGVDGVAAEPDAAAGLTHLRRGLQRALDVLDEGRTPSDAVTAAWLGLQEAAEDAGFRRGAAETPTEFTTRILRRLRVDEHALGTLRRCYLGVRFGGRTATPDDVDDVRTALRTLDAQWSAGATG
jgi:hypothetical protein